MTETWAVRWNVRDAVADVAGGYITELQQGYLADRPTAVARLAQLRHGAGKLPHQVPELWGVTGAERLYHHLDEVPEQAERALFLAVTLYALHQQSRTEPMHRSGEELGAAVRRLMGPDLEEPIRRRFVRIGTASTVDSLAYRLREIVSLLRNASIPLDYARLAARLHEAQFADGLQGVRRAWGRSFHAHRPSNEESDLDKDA